ncbi:MAG: type II secretion system protein GspK [Planctomycetota bacterium]
MSNESLNNYDTGNRPGIVLLVTLVLLVVLSTLGYTLSSRLADRRHRDRYIIDYQSARYGCDSAVKYALATLQDIDEPVLVARPNEPDFSDLFMLSEEEYEELLAEWAAERSFSPLESISDENDISGSNDFADFNEFSGITDFNDVNELGGITDFNDPNSLTIRGPYGPTWPFITEPVEFEIGPATVRIEIEDENAKYPIGWAMLNSQDVKREAEAGFETFCEWMDVNEVQIDELKEQLKDVNDIKPFKLNLTSITKVERKPISTSTSTRTTTRTRKARAARVRTIRTKIPVSAQLADYAKLFHSSLIDTEVLARPTIISERREESALKYMGRWGSRKVNINTAPRQVLEAAFTFGGDADEIAEDIIQQRRIKPFGNIEELKKELLKHTTAIEKCEEYITTASTFFTIKVTAVSGVAKVSAIIAITKNGRKIEKVAVISG